jgi:hypothetical protein
MMAGIYEIRRAVKYIPSFIMMGLDIQKLLRGIHTETHRQKGGFISLCLFFLKIRKIG